MLHALCCQFLMTFKTAGEKMLLLFLFNNCAFDFWSFLMKLDNHSWSWMIIHHVYGHRIKSFTQWKETVKVLVNNQRWIHEENHLVFFSQYQSRWQVKKTEFKTYWCHSNGRDGLASSQNVFLGCNRWYFMNFLNHTVGQNNQESRLQYWATRIRSFARTAHSFTCSSLLA